jgi:hypothetical protein
MTNHRDDSSQARLDFINNLKDFAKNNNIRNKGPLSVVLVINEKAKKSDSFPLSEIHYLTKKGGQVLGLGKSQVQAILARHKITRILAEEGGRTSRGSINIMRSYIDFINNQHKLYGSFDFDLAEIFWVEEVIKFFSGKPFVLKIDHSWGVRTSIRNLMNQAIARQKENQGTMFLGTMMQHLVGAKLEILLGPKILQHHNANQSDQDPNRHGDFDIEDVAIHVSTSPSESLIRKCNENLGKLKRPIIITTFQGSPTAEGLLRNENLTDRVDVIEFEQFIATNVLEIGRFTQDGRKETFQKIIDAYNEIVSTHETDPSLLIEMSSGK